MKILQFIFLTSYLLVLCSGKKDQCEVNDCKFGSCEFSQDGQSSSCKCPHNYEGEKCEKHIHKDKCVGCRSDEVCTTYADKTGFTCSKVSIVPNGKCKKCNGTDLCLFSGHLNDAGNYLSSYQCSNIEKVPAPNNLCQDCPHNTHTCERRHYEAFGFLFPLKHECRSLKEPDPDTVKSSELEIPVIIGITFGVLFLLSVFAFAIYRRRKTKVEKFDGYDVENGNFGQNTPLSGNKPMVQPVRYTAAGNERLRIKLQKWRKLCDLRASHTQNLEDEYPIESLAVSDVTSEDESDCSSSSIFQLLREGANSDSSKDNEKRSLAKKLDYFRSLIEESPCDYTVDTFDTTSFEETRDTLMTSFDETRDTLMTSFEAKDLRHSASSMQEESGSNHDIGNFLDSWDHFANDDVTMQEENYLHQDKEELADSGDDFVDHNYDVVMHEVTSQTDSTSFGDKEYVIGDSGDVISINESNMHLFA